MKIGKSDSTSSILRQREVEPPVSATPPQKTEARKTEVAPDRQVEAKSQQAWSETAEAKAERQARAAEGLVQARESLGGFLDSLDRMAPPGLIPNEVCEAPPTDLPKKDASKLSAEAGFAGALGQALGGGSMLEKLQGKNLLKDMVARGKKSEDPAVKNLASSAEHVLKGLELFEKKPAGKYDGMKGAFEMAMGGAEALKAGLEALQKRKDLDPNTAEGLKELNKFLGAGVNGIQAFSEACQAFGSLSEGKLREGLGHLGNVGENGFKTIRPLLEHCGIEKGALDTAEQLSKTGNAALQNMLKGLDCLDQKDYAGAVQNFGKMGAETLTGLAPLMKDSMGDYAKFLGPLVRSAGEIGAIAKDIETLTDKSKPYSDRLGAAQKVYSTLGVEVVRNLACTAFGDKAGNLLADSAKWLSDKAINYDQETAKIQQEGQNLLDKNWNHTIHQGQAMARLMGFSKGGLPADASPAEKKAQEALEQLPEYWSSNDDATQKQIKEVWKQLNQEGPEKAKNTYLRLVQKGQLKASRGLS